MQKGVTSNASSQQHPSHGGQSSNSAVLDASHQQYVFTNPLTSPATLPGSALLTQTGVQGAERTTALETVTEASPVPQQAVVVASQDLSRLLNSVQSSGTAPVLRQLSEQGILSVVGSRGQPVSFHGGTLVTDQTTGELQICHQPLTALVTAVQTPSASSASAISISGGTVHHLGQSPSRGGSIPHTNLHPKLLTMSAQQSNQQQQSQTVQRGVATVAAAGSSSSAIAAAGRVLMEAKPASGLSSTFPNLTALANQSSLTGPSPKKKVKVEEKTAVSPEVASNRKLVLDLKYKDMQEVKENYIDCLTEMFFLQNGGNMMDFFAWKKRPTPQLVHFLKSGNLDSDDEEDHGQERKINNEVKVITCSGSNVPLATPVAISTTLPPSVAALNQQGCDLRRPGGRHGMVFGHIQPLAQSITPVQSTIVLPGSVSVLSGTSSTVITTTSSVAQLTSTTTVTTPTITSTAVSMPQLQSQLIKIIPDSKPLTVQTTFTSKSTILSPSSAQSSFSVKSSKSPPLSPSRLHTRQHTISAVYNDTVGSQEAIVERAKQEAQVMQRVAELRKEGLWSTRRLPKVQEPPRNKGHWDYLLEEMQWLAADFAQERKWKKAAARKLAKMVSKYFQELEQKEIKAEKEEAQKLRKIASQIAKQVREFWSNIEKVVQYKQQARLDEKRKKALDLHLNFIVDQTEKYSTWLTEGLQKGSRAGSSVGGSVLVTPDHSSDGGDDEFEPEDHESDDEETIEKEEEEAGVDEVSTKEEIDALQKESELPIEELLKTLPQEVLDKPASLSGDQEADDEADDKDKEFKAAEEAVDEEDTIAEQEKHEKKIDYSKELKDLQDENEMSMEELYKKYAEAYTSDFEMSELEDETESEDESDDEEDSDDEEEEEDEEDQEMTEEKDVGLEFLMDPEKGETDKSEGDFESQGPGKEITDIAAEAQSLQPKGYTLETTTVKTSVPFLLKHTLREYQHVGLDWLATMYEKRLNGILADEMGLGKTIQTIALLAHLACEKGIWGPHLIVVPTSVMLNWEMEIKKWCPAFKILTYYGTQKERKMKRQGWTKTNAFHVCITSYKLVIQDHQSFRRKKWKYFILDEAQNIKNFKSQRWQTLLNFSSQRRLLLTGTPLQNSLMELWSLMHFLMPHVFQSHREFKEWFANPLTGMIEGSHEYNESLIKRLHKVLRPFLLRRLKQDVEKQMPKKYEHVIMCHLSKRQRYLYEDFMSQTKTKETLATGHFMSVINILMQLRKVCNHPSLFDPRPIVSPFKMEGITHHIPSVVLNCLSYDPFKDVDIRSVYPALADMEKDLPAFIAHRVKRLQTTRKMIEEIDDEPDPPPRPLRGKLKPVSIKNLAIVEQAGRLSPASSQARPASPAVISSSVSMATTAAVSQTVVNSSPLPSTSITQSQQASTPQAKVLPQSAGQNVVLTSTGHQVNTSQPITVQIHQTEQGARLMIPAGQLSQLPAGFIQIVQTSMGQQIIASSPHTATSSPVQANVSSTPVPSVANTSVSVVNGPTITTSASSLTNTTVTAVNTQVKASVQLPSTSTVTTGQKPVMKVAPLASETSSPIVSVDDDIKDSKPTATVETTTTTATSARMSARSEKKRHLELKKKSPLFHKSLCEKKLQQRKDILEYIARMNKKHCEVKPVYGQDLCQAVNVLKDMEKTHVKDNTWSGLGMAYCHNVNVRENPNDNDYYWKQTEVLSELIRTPEQYLKELEEILNRYVFVTPTVMAPRIQMHASHPAPSFLTELRHREFVFQKELSPKTNCIHKISTAMMVQFPELRLIQYDCGKLQTLDVLLRQLKSGSHRVLIFTQMTKMLNILEAFLNFHGHRYLRLDGTTKVEQRQFLMERFNADKRIFCFILSTRSGGIGVNLTGADTVIFYDSDWNPTMDAQAQDRCHRIGQTRDVHIYRLISERTIEENILKKANQKRMLGDMAIEGGNFTTAFFKEQTIKELFSEPSGLQSLANEKEEMERIKAEPVKDNLAKGDMKTESEGPSDKTTMAQFEKVLAKAEDETDAQAVDLVKAEQKAELAEFDENIPWDEREAEQKKEDEMSRAEQEIAMLDKELSPVERYAVCFMEMELEPLTEELDMAEDDIEQAKKDWELGRLKALKEEEERRAELEEDEMLYIYSRNDAYNQVKKKAPKKAKAVKNATAKAVTPARASLGRNKVKQVEEDAESDVDYTPTSKFKRTVPRGNSSVKRIVSPGRGRGRRLSASKRVLAKAEAVVVSEGDGAINVTMKSKAREPKSSKKTKADSINVTIPNDESVITSPSEVVGKASKCTPKLLKQKRQSVSKQLQSKAAVTQALKQQQQAQQQLQTQQQLLQQQVAISGQLQIPQIVVSSPQKVQQNITLQPLGTSPQSIQIANPQPTITQLMHQQYQAELAQQQQTNVQLTRPATITQQQVIQQPITQTVQNSHAIHNATAAQRVLNSALSNTQPQLLSASQLQHLKQIISKAAQHNLTKPGPAPTKQQVAVGQAVLQQQQVVQQVSLQGASIPAPVHHVMTHQVPQQVIAQAQQPLAHVASPVQQPVQFIAQAQRPSNTVQGPAYQQVVSHNSSGQPTIQFIKVNGNSSSTPQPQQQAVLQYCVNAAGASSGAVRLQNLNLVQGPNTQQGVVYLQLAGGKAIPVSLAASSPLSVPVNRMVSTRAPTQQGASAPKIRQVAMPQQQYIARTVVHNPSPTPQPTRISAPISRFQNPNNNSTTVTQNPKSPHIQNLKVASVQNVSNAVPTNRLKIPKANSTSPKENAVPSPFWNPNLVIRTRRAANQADVGKVTENKTELDLSEANVEVTSKDIPFLVGKPSTAAQAGAAPNNQFISILKAGNVSSSNSVGVSNVVIKQNSVVPSQGIVMSNLNQVECVGDVTVDGNSTNSSVNTQFKDAG